MSERRGEGGSSQHPYFPHAHNPPCPAFVLDAGRAAIYIAAGLDGLRVFPDYRVIEGSLWQETNYY
jgi:hypothetical protein